MVFVEFNRLFNFIHVNFLNDIVSRSQIHGNQRP